MALENVSKLLSLQTVAHSKIPVSVFNYSQGRWEMVTISDGFVSLLNRQKTKPEIIAEWNQIHTFNELHPLDSQRLRYQLENRQLKKDDLIDETVRMKLNGSEAYSSVHMMGYVLEADHQKLLVVVHDDLSSAFMQSMQDDNEHSPSFPQPVEESDGGFAIIDQKTHEIYYSDSLMDQVMNPVEKYQPGMSFEEYVYGKDTKRVIDFESYAQVPEALAENETTKSRFLMNVKRSVWNKRDVYLVEATRLDFRYFDNLTNLPNMSYFRLRTKDMTNNILFMHLKPTIIFFDTKGMKSYNRKYGFEAGDQLLKDTGKIIENAFKTFYTFRFSDDHFVVMAGDQHLEDKISEIAEKVPQAAVHASVEIRAGVYELEDLSESAVIAGCDKAKLACDSIKNNMHKYIRYYDESLNKHAQIYDYVTAHIDEAIENDWIKVYYQPVVRTLTDSLCSFEALSRWIDPVYGFLNPAEFIGALEDTHQIHKLDTYVIYTICRQMRERLDQHLTVVPVSFNLSRVDFTSCDIFAVVEDAVKKYDISRDYIHVEITESIIANSVEIRAWANRFRNAGYEVWMDDFGSGYSSLNVLKDYDFDELKFDMAFLSAFTPKSQIILTSTVSMAKKIHIQTLAEGVETKEEYEFLKEIGCEKVQGYYYGKPLPLDEAFQHVEDIHLPVEDQAWSHFYRMAGSTDLMRNIPLMIIEEEGAHVHFLYVNEEYKKMLKGFGVESVSQAEDEFNNSDNKVRGSFEQMAEEARNNYDTVSTFVVNHHEMFRINMRQLTHQDNRTIFETSIMLMDVSGVGNNINEMNSFLVEMVMIYRDVNIIDYDSDHVDGLVKDGTLYSSQDRHMDDIRRFRQRYCDMYIEPDQRDEYMAFCDERTILKRIDESPIHSVSHHFQVYNPEKSCYEWKFFTEVRVLDKKHQNLTMELIKSSSQEAIDQMNRKD